MRRLFIIPIALLLVAAAGCSSIANLTSKSVKANTWYPVSGYIDGDTFNIKVNKEYVTVRMLYIDAPEIKAYTEPFGAEAAERTKLLLADSKEVRLSFDESKKDSYDRVLAMVELKDGTILNEQLLEEGLAKVLIIEPNVKMENLYKKLEQQAKQDKLAIWSSGKESSHADVTLRKAVQTGLSIEVDKKAELVTIKNTSANAINLEGWKLVSVLGNQTYTFQAIELPAKGQIIVSSGDSNLGNQSGVILEWEADNVWDDTAQDSAELYNENNELAAEWEDE
ncbi:thermonuclease family protein [Paenibacillus sp. HB172176]|uniref:thermonuclease family protein n=1 Tax=Paenibacillus sp. HB172176 TaxID=2493690 RepID=UPI0014388A4B|nr:thermonuclease family protein [Paenibacillus sp. HB172176]